MAEELENPRIIGQCFEALATGYTHAVLVTTVRVARRTTKKRNPETDRS